MSTRPRSRIPRGVTNLLVDVLPIVARLDQLIPKRLKLERPELIHLHIAMKSIQKAENATRAGVRSVVVFVPRKFPASILGGDLLHSNCIAELMRRDVFRHPFPVGFVLGQQGVLTSIRLG